MKLKLPRRIMGDLIALDELGNAVVLDGNAYRDEKKLIADSVGLVGVDPSNPTGK